MGIAKRAMTYAAIILSCTSYAHAGVEETCQPTTYHESSANERDYLLRYMKHALVESAQLSMVSLSSAKQFLQECSSQNCRDFVTQFKSILQEQFYIGKFARALAEADLSWAIDPWHTLTLENVVARIEAGEISPRQIANFSISGLTFNDEERSQTLRAWTNVFVRTANRMPPNTPVVEIIEEAQNYFIGLSYDIISTNPLLALLDEQSINSDVAILDAFDRLLEFNQEFLETVEGYRSNHRDNFWSYFNLSLPDHEMGLVNFPQQADLLIQKFDKPRDRDILCSAWTDVVHQQRLRVRASIGVGFSAAVVCGIGIWSGVSTIPAAALCAPTIADGLWGAYRGYSDARMAHIAFYAGRQVYDDGSFSEGMMSAERSQALERQGDIVFLINMLGLIPPIKAVATASSAIEHPLIELIKIPGMDMAVSTIEANTPNIVYMMYLIRGPVWIQEDYHNEMLQLKNNINM